MLIRANFWKLGSEDTCLASDTTVLAANGDRIEKVVSDSAAKQIT